MDDITLCTATDCIYANKCFRHTQGDLDNPYQSYCDLSRACCKESGFDYFIPILNERN